MNKTETTGETVVIRDTLPPRDEGAVQELPQAEAKEQEAAGSERVPLSLGEAKLLLARQVLEFLTKPPEGVSQLSRRKQKKLVACVEALENLIPDYEKNMSRMPELFCAQTEDYQKFLETRNLNQRYRRAIRIGGKRINGENRRFYKLTKGPLKRCGKDFDLDGILETITEE